MIVLRDPAEARGIADLSIRRAIKQRFVDMSEAAPFDPDVDGFIVVVEPGDSVEQLEAAVDFPVLSIDGIPFGDPNFAPAFEVLEEHSSCYELVLVPGDGDFGIVIFIPKQNGVSAELLSFCESYATPAP